MAAADPIAGLVAFLKADSGVDAITDGRVYGGRLPAADAVNMPRAAIVLRPAGGGSIGTATQDYGDTRVIVACYGANDHDAHQVWLAAHPALKHLRHEEHADCLLLWARRTSGPSASTDPDTDWPLSLSTWQVLASEVAA